VALDEARQDNARLSFLTDVAAYLHGASTRVELYSRLSRAVTMTMADWSTIVVPSGDELIRVAAFHKDPVLNSLPQRFVDGYPHAFTGPSPGVVYRSGEPLRMARLAAEIVSHLDDSVASAAYGRTVQLLGDGPGLIMPILPNDAVVAVLTMVRTEGEAFNDQDVATMDRSRPRWLTCSMTPSISRPNGKRQAHFRRRHSPDHSPASYDLGWPPVIEPPARGHPSRR
jgi:hypothetical protein